jgi:hypothetical protein
MRKTASNLIRYFNMITEISQKTQPPDSRGGLLADQMGLGKSLTMISLIALNTCKTREPIVFTAEGGHLKRLKSTLVVVPYSREWRRPSWIEILTDLNSSGSLEHTVEKVSSTSTQRRNTANLLDI